MTVLKPRGEPAYFLSHWPNMYANGTGQNFHSFQIIVKRLNAAYGGRFRWMKLSEIARYWAAKKLTRIESSDNVVTFYNRVATPNFTFTVNRIGNQRPTPRPASSPSD